MPNLPTWWEKTKVAVWLSGAQTMRATPQPLRTKFSLDRSLQTNTADIMSKLSIRTNPENPNHHLWNNHGTWFIHYVVHPTPITKERVRRSGSE